MVRKKELNELSYTQLRRCFSEVDFDFKTTRDVEPLREIIGQDRALKALQLGLDIDSSGYNIFITGFAGTGRKTTIKAYLEKISQKKKKLFDKIYVNNFQNPDMPLLISLPAGKGNEFKKEMDLLIETIVHKIPLIFEEEDYQRAKKKLIEENQDMEKKVFHEFEQDVAKNGFALIQVQYGSYTKPEIAPLIDGKAVPINQLPGMVKSGGLTEERLERLKQKYELLHNKMDTVFKKSREIERKLRQEIQSLDSSFVMPFINDLIADIYSRYDEPKIQEYLNNVSKNIIDNIETFKGTDQEKENPLAKMFTAKSPGDPFLEYSVNVIVDNSRETSVPIIIENYPTYRNLFGTIEKVVDKSGYLTTDFSRIKAGSFVRADGGYLVIDAMDALMEYGVWSTMKRVLKTGFLEIQNFDPYLMYSTSSGLKPEPMPIDVKVVMIGDHYIYHLLYDRDEDFHKTFKIKADFDSAMPLNENNMEKYVAFIKKITDDEQLLPFSASAVAEVIEFGLRLSERQQKLSTKFSQIADLIRESSYWAKKSKSTVVEQTHIEQTLEERRMRLNLFEEKLQEMIQDETLLIETDGAKVGQINGLAVFNYGDYIFAKPNKITAQVSLGRAGFINIEREAKLSGKIHDKGVLILSGYFRAKYAQEFPLSLSASICFEQSYSGVDGDSASSTEIFVLLSALSELPIKQGIAVTGSVNQKGEIQPIGGVNVKIEGFFDVCHARGLTGKQGVIIPIQNVEELMLRKDIVEAVRKGKFHIYPISNIDQGIEILTGKPAGALTKLKKYPANTVNNLVLAKLRSLAITLRDFGQENNKKTNKKTKTSTGSKRRKV
ncbi:AAA family ATPase [bacterium]|nr:AAA family ATPase [bacterium]